MILPSDVLMTCSPLPPSLLLLISIFCPETAVLVKFDSGDAETLTPAAPTPCVVDTMRFTTEVTPEETKKCLISVIMT